MSDIYNNYQDVQARIAKAASKAGKDPKDILLLAVSKTIDVPTIQEAVSIGMTSLGENKVQEILDKYEHFGKDVNWHLIGHLQTNKVKYIIDKVVLIHSVDSLKLANEIEKRAAQHNLTAEILIEVNMEKEASKFGVRPEDVYDLVCEISNLSHIRVKGLMTVAPFVENPEDNRDCFRKMRQLLVDINTKNINNVCMDILSMGMTGDYEVAIEEGATIVRVGTGIFGRRNYAL